MEISLESLMRQVEAAKHLAREARAAAYVLRNAARWEQDLENISTYTTAADGLEKAAEAFQVELRRDKSQ